MRYIITLAWHASFMLESDEWKRKSKRARLGLGPVTARAGYALAELGSKCKLRCRRRDATHGQVCLRLRLLN
jgi:hypothetical protein